MLLAIIVSLGQFFSLLLTYHTAKVIELYTGTFWNGLKKKIGNIIGWSALVGLCWFLAALFSMWPDIAKFAGTFVFILMILFLYVTPIIIVEPINIFKAIVLSPKVLIRTLKGLFGAAILTFLPIPILGVIQFLFLKSVPYGTLIVILISTVFATASIVAILLLYLEYKRQSAEK